MPDPPRVNQAHWNALAARHGRGDDTYYDVSGFLAGRPALDDREVAEVTAAIGDVAGRDLLHLQCHFGLGTLSWARRGARVTGVDFSPVAVDRARRLAAEAGLEAEFVESDVLDLPASLTGRFDVVFASYGVLCWIPSAAAWMRSAAACLRPGGALVLVEIHPLVHMMATIEPPVADSPYHGEEAQHYTSDDSYALGGLEGAARETTQWPHGLGEVVTAAAGAGLRVEALTEWLGQDQDSRLVAGYDAQLRFPFGGQFLPTSYALRARR